MAGVGSDRVCGAPTGGSITAGEVAAIRVLGAGRSFDAALGEDGVSGWVDEQGSVFKMEDQAQGAGRRRKVRLGRRVWQVHASGSMAVFFNIRSKAHRS